ncbi:MAG: 2-amino-4-hydroxy-6-hydroxymethyldihydropteridine diphosphokinase [Desulfuromonas sp.]|uniref:2-amino-4-hydroxy-6- hydroxymethyldihydropteridine diphosphokinase n=1 Tax=Desulfuromonas sp. TaxID=892 RepID=UPI000CBDF762|nr:2-amino-4-hydroxy-6-hydroxymethyldihydropteridine diphosphokinase [Desulfuromonas sp.]PLX84280.1 MAG: 2-amino-4-hydroxy-6-hydroxymethyldihydropteridine diphosphokinase [Desulfuromonas sp.]
MIRTTTAYLALGSNLGERRESLRGARTALAGHPELHVAAWSNLYETAPVGGPEGQGPYLNAVLAVETSLTPGALLTFCLEVEKSFGRQRRQPWGPRTLDIDLLLYGGETRCEPHLILPHPRLHLRRFVLAPLCDLAPEVVHPLLGETVRDLLTQLPAGEEVRRLADQW